MALQVNIDFCGKLGRALRSFLSKNVIKCNQPWSLVDACIFVCMCVFCGDKREFVILTFRSMLGCASTLAQSLN